MEAGVNKRTKTLAITAACVVSAIVAAAQEPPQAPAGSEIPLGTWSGTGRLSGPNIRNPMPAPHNLVVQKIEDPHWRWRGGSKEMVMVSVRGRGAGAGGPAGPGIDVGRIEYRGETLSYVYSRPTGEVTCNLARKEGARFEGACSGSGFNAQVVLNQPEPEMATGMAQGFALGRWTGTVTSPEGTNQQAVTLRLSAGPGPGESLQASLVLQFGAFDARDLRTDGGGLSFAFGGGNFAGNCKLARQPDGKLEGTCTAQGGQLIMTLAPPNAAAPVAPRP
jgi:hypothetical protein